MSAFSIFTDKKKKNKQESVPSVEEYYLKLARRTTLAKFICIIIIGCFALFSYSNFKEELTIENFRYMVKFADFGAETVEETASIVYFDSDTSNKGNLLRGDLAVLNTSGIKVYDFSGERLFEQNFKSDYPKMVSNTKNIIVCDIGGYDLQVFNSYSNVFTEKFDYPIYGSSASASGGFVVVSSAKNYRSAFYVYDGNCRVIFKHFFADKYIDCISISEDGKEVVTLLHYSKDGVIISLLMKFSVDSEQPIYQIEFKDELPLQISYMSDGSYAVLTSEALRFYSAKNTITGEIFFEEKSLLGYEFSNNYAIITFNTVGLSAGTELDVYAKDGSLVAVRSYEGALLDKKLSSDTLYVLSHGLILTIDLKGVNQDKASMVDTEFKEIIVDNSSVILFSDNKAKYFKENETKSNTSVDSNISIIQQNK